MVPELLRRYAVPGASVALVEDGKPTWSRGYGEGISDETVFQVASISKSVTAWGIMNLVESGDLSLDSRLLDHVPWRPPTSKFDERAITIRRLLSHTAGLSVHGVEGVEQRRELLSTRAALEGRGDNPAVRLLDEPGRHWRYSGGGYGALQLLLEEAYDQPFSEVMQRRVLGPLEMKDSSFDPPAELRKRLPQAKSFDGNVSPPYHYVLKAAAGLNTTAPDLARFVAAVFEPRGQEGMHSNTMAGLRERVVSPRGVREMLRTEPKTSGMFAPLGRGGYGLGYATERLAGGNTLASHTGSNPGWASLFALVPEERAGLVVLTNADTGLLLYADLLCDWVPAVTGARSSLCRSLSGVRAATVVGWLLFAIALLVLAAFILAWGKRREPTSRRGIFLGTAVGLGGLVWLGIWHVFSIGGLRLASVVSPRFFLVTAAVEVATAALVVSVVRFAVPVRRLVTPVLVAALAIWIIAVHTDLLGRAVLGTAGSVPIGSLSIAGWAVTGLLAALTASRLIRRRSPRMVE